jgi:nucleoside-diphosphate-sugar epimerase
VHGTERLALAAARAGVARFVLASTRGVYGSVSNATIDEHTPTSPDTAYRESKLRAERIVEACSKANGLPYVTLRLPSMLGAGAIGWLGLFRAVAAGGFRVIGSGKNRQHPCYIDDAVEALVRAGATKGVEGETFLVGGVESVSTRDFLEQIAAVLGVSLSRVHLPAAPYVAARTLVTAAARLRRKLPEETRNEMFIAGYVIDDSKARRLLGYAPAGSLDEAIRQTAAWFRANGHL